jgi:hypothetical protein
MFLEEQAATTVLNSDESKEKILRCLIKSHEKSEMYEQLHDVFKPQNTGKISHLEVRTGDWQWPYDPKTVEDWTRGYDPQTVEDHLFNHNQLHIG